MKKGLLTLVLCLALCGSCLAEDVISLDTPYNDQIMGDACYLPDGRVVLAGTVGEKGNYQDSRAWLFCLNPDGTVAWDFRHPGEGNCDYAFPSLLADGTIGVIFRNSPNQELIQTELHRFTQDGQMTGEPVDIFQEHLTLDGVTPDCIGYAIIDPYASDFYRYYVDREGNILFRIHSEDSMSGGGNMLLAEDGVIFYGTDRGYPSPAKVMKVDLYGNPVWETVLPAQTNDANGTLMAGCRTEEGNYVFWLMESSGDPRGKMTWRIALLMMDADGRILWTNAEDTEREMAAMGARRCNDIAVVGDFIVVAAGTASYEAGEPFHYLWYTKDGTFVGHTTISVDSKDFGGAYGSGLVALGGEMYECIQTRDVDDEDIKKEMDSVQNKLYKVPRPE